MNATAAIEGTVAGVVNGFQVVDLDEKHPTLGSRVHLDGAQRADGARVGQRVRLYYSEKHTKTFTRGFWYAETIGIEPW